MGLIKLGLIGYGVYLVSNHIREKKDCHPQSQSQSQSQSQNHHQDPNNNNNNNTYSNSGPKPPGSPHVYQHQQYPAPSQYQPPPQNTTYGGRDEKNVYTDNQRMIAPTYDEATSPRFTGAVAAHECPNCGHDSEKVMKA